MRKPTKLMARMMFEMVKDINSKFPDGKAHVTCYTCHRGADNAADGSSRRRSVTNFLSGVGSMSGPAPEVCVACDNTASA